jgi:hypothetical protein
MLDRERFSDFVAGDSSLRAMVMVSRGSKFDGLNLFWEVLGAKYGCFRTQQTSGVLGCKRGLFYGLKRTQG